MSENSDSTEKRMHPLLWFGGAVMFTLVAVVFASNVAKGLKAKKWTEAKCDVTQFERTYSRKGNHHLRVEFNYVYNGQAYTSRSFSMTGNSTTDRDVFTRYAAGEQAVCYVNPANPSEAVLQRNLSAWDWLYPPIGAAIGFGMFLGGRNEIKRRRDEKAAREAVILEALESAEKEVETRRAA